MHLSEGIASVDINKSISEFWETMDCLNINDVHSFKQENLNIVLDINSGAVHVVDDPTFITLKALEKVRVIGSKQHEVEPTLGKELVKEIKEELLELKKEELLFTTDDGKITANNDKPIVKSLCCTWPDCNLRCNYCFASSGSFGDKNH